MWFHGRSRTVGVCVHQIACIGQGDPRRNAVQRLVCTQLDEPVTQQPRNDQVVVLFVIVVDPITFQPQVNQFVRQFRVVQPVTGITHRFLDQPIQGFPRGLGGNETKVLLELQVEVLIAVSELGLLDLLVFFLIVHCVLVDRVEDPFEGIHAFRR
ncbi:hypothetical protein D3C81_925200 [compost metagenome]